MKKYLYTILVVLAICIVEDSTMAGNIAIMVGMVAIGCFGLLDLAVFCANWWDKRAGPTAEQSAGRAEVVEALKMGRKTKILKVEKR